MIKYTQRGKIMRLKNILIVVQDIEKSKQFYHDVFGLQVIRDFEENVILSEGLVLQEKTTWDILINSDTVVGNATELFFEENCFDEFLQTIEKTTYKIEIIGDVRINSWGKRVVMIKDLDGHLIEVAEA